MIKKGQLRVWNKGKVPLFLDQGLSKCTPGRLKQFDSLSCFGRVYPKIQCSPNFRLPLAFQDGSRSPHFYGPTQLDKPYEYLWYDWYTTQTTALISHS